MTRHGYDKIPQEDEKALQKFGFLSYVLFQWMSSVFKTGKHRALEQSDFLPFFIRNRKSSGEPEEGREKMPWNSAKTTKALEKRHKNNLF